VKKPAVTVVRFTADWCPSCKAMRHAWEEAKAAYKGRVVFREVDTEKPEGHAEAVANTVMGLPVIIFQKNGETVQRVDSAMTYAKLKKQIESLLT
jgi:thiol-disulfide isomerase/thioredoxin